MRGIGIVLAGLVWMAQPALAQDAPLTHDWVSQASPTELQTRLLGDLAQLYRDVSVPRELADGRLEIIFASAPRSAWSQGVCVSQVMTVELSPIIEQPHSHRDLGDVEVRPSSVSHREGWFYMEDAPQMMPTGRVSTDGTPHVAFDKVKTNEMCAEHASGWRFALARDGSVFQHGVDLLKNLKDLAVTDPTEFAALLNECVGYQCSRLPQWFSTSSTDQISGVSEVDCEEMPGLDGVSGRCLNIRIVAEDPSYLFIYGRPDEKRQWRAFKFVTFTD